MISAVLHEETFCFFCLRVCALVNFCRARALQAHNLNNFDSQITKNYNRITKTKIALISLGAVEEPEIGKRDVSHLEARARDWIEKLRKIKMKGQRGVHPNRPRKDKFGSKNETHVDLKLRALHRGKS